jgi:hypothetical protein
VAFGASLALLACQELSPMTRSLLYMVVALGLLLTGCQARTVESTSAPTSIPALGEESSTPVPTANLSQTPEPGKANAVGRVMTRGANEPYANVIVRLAPVVDLGTDEDDAFALDDANSPGTVTDAQGYFAFANVEPGDYVLIFGNVSTIYLIPTSTPDHAIVVKLTAGQVTDIGELPIMFPDN